MIDFSSKVVLITGASSGIGAGTARAFAKHGAYLSITGRNKENLSKVAEECRKLGAKEVLEIISHLDRQEDIGKTMKETINKFQQLDVLVNNAGVSVTTPMGNITPQEYDEIFNINVKAPLFLSQSALPYLEKTKGNIVNVSSVLSQIRGQPQLIVYCMSKSAVDQFTKTLALEAAKTGVRVNAVNPAFAPTNINRKGFATDEAKEARKRNSQKFHPLGEINIEVEDIADNILFLASDKAKTITGTCLNVDRGRVLTGQ